MSDNHNQLKTLEQIIKSIATILMKISMGMVAIMMFLGIGDVIGRYIFNKPITGTFEIFEILLPGIVLFGLAYAQLAKAHIAVDIFYSRFPTRLRAIVGIVNTLWAIILFALVGWRGIMLALMHWHTGRMISNIRVPIYFVESFIPVGALAICLVLIVDLLNLFTEKKKEI